MNKSSETLAIMIIAYRVLGLNKSVAIDAMQELYNRKQNGDEFDFQSFIDSNVNEIKKAHPQTNLDSMKLINSLLKTHGKT